ncbi:hypothetical protein RHMOL_Rhmol09G0063200 [Rhododendron molle]|uniref:Uncharacterized protein n=1 Tax=Rhododendron molle TaxID=49168 RepID=A0ACC0MA83_RHOML|nr:hypothetical protein RHMOL_Rhmol09G0063200 [Rhododendron molle]
MFSTMAKKFRLSKSFFAGSSSGPRRLSKVAKGKGIAKSLDVDMERDLILDDMTPEDFESDWVLPPRLAKARVAAEAKFRELFDSAYEPWEEVRGNWDHSDSEGMDVEDREFPTPSCGCFSASTNFILGNLHGLMLLCRHVRRLRPVVWELCPTTLVPWFLLVVLLQSLRLTVAFLLVARGHLVGLYGLKDLSCRRLVLMSWGGVWGCDTPLVGVPDLRSPSYMEVVEEIPSSPSSCVTDSSASDHHKLSVEDSPSDGVEDGFQDSALGPRNLRAKRIVALWRYRMEDCDSAFLRHSSAQKRMKVYDVFDVAGVGVVMFSVRIYCLSCILGVEVTIRSWQVLCTRLTMANPEHPRLIIHDFLSLDLCKELEFIHKSCGTVGYRLNVFSTTLSHLIATNCGHLIMPFVPIRERLKEKAEEFFGCEFELFVEFTGLISWSTGASIGWHSDDNRPYLKQRDFAAVCYLNSHGEDFEGGLFHFQDWQPTAIVPMAGDVVMYTADSRNIHSVDEITGGERLTLTLWFSRDGSHDEDAKLISFLSEKQLSHSIHETGSFLPQPASSRMYWFPPDTAFTYESGFDICFARIHAHGYDLYSVQDTSCFSASDSSNDLSEVLMAPLRLAREHELFDEEFVNVLHVLQAVQFYCWKASELQTSGHEKRINVVPLSPSEREEVNRLKHVFLKDERVPDKLFSSATGNEHSQQPFNWAHVSAAVTAWEAYSNKLVKEMLLSLPYWKTHQSIFSVPSDLGK